MGQPVKLSDALVLDARIAAQAQDRSIAGQIEFWAKLGRSMELLLNGRQVQALFRKAETRPLAESLAAVDTPEGRERVKAYLGSGPHPHFEAHPWIEKDYGSIPNFTRCPILESFFDSGLGSPRTSASVFY